MRAQIAARVTPSRWESSAPDTPTLSAARSAMRILVSVVTMRSGFVTLRPAQRKFRPVFSIELPPYSSHPRHVSHLSKAREVFDIELAALKTVRAQLDHSFNNAVTLISETLSRRGKIVIVGIGKSGNVGAKIAATLTSTGSTSVLLNSVDALHGDLGVINDGDLILALSYSGESEELLNLLPPLKRFLVKIISITGAPKSSLGRHSDLVLNVHVPKEACP